MTADAFIYVLDASVFIEAARRYYAFDLVPRFWEVLVEKANDGRIVSVDRVQEELMKGNDELTEWVKTHLGEVFVSTDNEAVIGWYRRIISWVNRQGQFFVPAKDEFAMSADGWLVAYARALRRVRVVVTQEVLARDARKKIPIPNVCQAFGVRYMDTFAMLRELRVKL